MKTSNDMLLRVIAIFKYLKAAMLFGLGVGAFRLLHKDLGEVVEHWVEALRLDPGNRFIDAALVKAALLSPAQIKKLGLGSFVYAALFVAEGTGLWLEKRWGEWLTVIITSTLIPVEIYEIYRHPSGIKVAVLVINVGIVVYLIYRIRNKETGSKRAG
jgi:uncharacterized membrane protein (DUF2068 family)